jgi:hypothetical protein
MRTKARRPLQLAASFNRHRAGVPALHAVAVAITQPKKGPQRMVGEPGPSFVGKQTPSEKGGVCRVISAKC